MMHIRAWLERVADLVARGQEVYRGDDMLQEAGDSLVMKKSLQALFAEAKRTLGPDSGGVSDPQ